MKTLSLHFLLFIPILVFGQNNKETYILKEKEPYIVIASEDFDHESIIPSSLSCSSVLINTNTGSGSGVFIRDSSFVYFVTARHVLFNDSFQLVPKVGNLIFYARNIVTDTSSLLKIDFTEANRLKLIKYDKTRDIALIVIATISHVSLDTTSGRILGSSIN